MNLIKKTVLSSILLSLSLISVANAERYRSLNNFYLEGNLGSVSADDGFQSESSGTVGIGLGYKINPNFAVVGKYQTLYDKGNVNSESLSIRAVGLLPITPQVTLNGKIGIGSTTAKALNHTAKGTFNYGIGADYAIAPNFSVGLDLDFYSTDSDAVFDSLKQTNMSVVGKYSF